MKEKKRTEIRECVVHGLTEFGERIRKGVFEGFRCRKCQVVATTERRRKVTALLKSEAGNKCIRCGYDKSSRALVFHHRDPHNKEFSILQEGLTLSLEKLREEVKKCDLICANCHAEIHEQWDLLLDNSKVE